MEFAAPSRIERTRPGIAGVADSTCWVAVGSCTKARVAAAVIPLYFRPSTTRTRPAPVSCGDDEVDVQADGINNVAQMRGTFNTRRNDGG